MRSASSQDHPFSLGMQYPVARTTETFGFKQSDKPKSRGNATRIRRDFRKILTATANAEVPHLTLQTPRGLGDCYLSLGFSLSLGFALSLGLASDGLPSDGLPSDGLEVVGFVVAPPPQPVKPTRKPAATNSARIFFTG